MSVEDEKNVSEVDEKDQIDETLEEVDENDDDVEVVYKTERNPLVKVLVSFGVFIMVSVVGLFAAGFIMGLLNINPPHLDSQVVKDQWDKRVSQTTSKPPSELEPAENSATSN